MTIDARPTTTEPRSRRAILAGAIGGVAGLIANRFASPDRTDAASGDPLIIGSTTNNAGTGNTTLTTASTGTGLLITQNGAGTALRGSAVGPGSIAGFFTANNGTGISGVTGAPGSYGVFAQNNGAAGSAGALRASGGNNHGVVATTNAEGGVAIFAENTSAGVDITAGSGIRALSGGGTLAHIQPGGLYNDGAGEFAGPIGVIGASTENDDGVFVGVLGLGGATGYGVWGIGDAAAGVYGTSHFSPGVYAASDLGFGTFSLAVSGIGVYGQSQSSSGVSGYSNSGNGLHGQSLSGYAIYGDGNGAVTGTFSKASGTFRIDHPLDPANKFLSHSFVESPDMMNIYNGIATLDAKGEATVTLPAWFGTLNKEFRYQLTAIGSAGPNLHVKSKVNGNTFAIGGGPAGQEVSWQLTGIRQDAWANAHRVVVEEAKPKAQKGLYLHPKENSQPESKGIGYAERETMEAKRPAPASAAGAAAGGPPSSS